MSWTTTSSVFFASRFGQILYKTVPWFGWCALAGDYERTVVQVFRFFGFSHVNRHRSSPADRRRAGHALLDACFVSWSHFDSKEKTDDQFDTR